MEEQLVRDWMTPLPYTITPETALADAYSLMREHRIRRLPVLDKNKLVGVVTLNDIRSAAPMGSLGLLAFNNVIANTPVSRVMSAELVTIEPDVPVREAASLMHRHKFGGLPVVKDGYLVGVITESDLFRMVMVIDLEDV